MNIVRLRVALQLLIVTENVQAELPHELVAVHVTVVVPVANVEPDDGEHVTDAVGEPVAVGVVHVAIGLVVHCVMSEGQVPMIGDSFIVTVNVQLELPQLFVAVHVTIVAPVAKVEPDAGEQLTVGAGVPVADGVANVAT
jgi:hypothetical protein